MKLTYNIENDTADTESDITEINTQCSHTQSAV